MLGRLRPVPDGAWLRRGLGILASPRVAITGDKALSKVDAPTLVARVSDSGGRPPLDLDALTSHLVRSGNTLRSALLVMLLGLVLAGALATWLWTSERETTSAELESAGLDLVESIATHLSEVTVRLIAVSGLFESSQEVTQPGFSGFVEKIGVSPAAALAYMPLVPSEDLDGFQTAMRIATPDFSVFEFDEAGVPVPVGERPEYAPVMWVEPSDAFIGVLGFDSLSDPIRAAALARAGQSGELAATPFIRLVSEEESDGFLLYQPVTDRDTRHVVGFVVAPMDLSDLLDGSRITLKSEIDWTVTISETHSEVSEVPKGDFTGSVWTGGLYVGGQHWHISAVPTSSSRFGNSSAGPLSVLALGLLSSVFAGIARGLQLRRRHERREVEILRALAQSRDQFLASVSHELRTPLTSVLGFAELLLDPEVQLSDVEVQSLAAVIANEAADVSYIVDDLLVAARSEVNLVTVLGEPFDVGSLVTRVLEANGGPSMARIEFLSDGDECWAEGDPVRVRQVLRGLIANAVRHGGDHIRIRIASANEAVQVEVADDGPGVPPNQWEKIFQPYYRVQNSPSHPISLGIGLTVARQLARLMQGELSYRYEDNWSVFDLRLPRSANPAGAKPEAAIVAT